MTTLPLSIGDGLVIRRATRADIDAVTAFNARIHGDDDEFPPHAIEAMTRDLMNGSHPTTSASDFVLVEEDGTGTIVSSLCLIPQDWAYDGIPFGVGRIELVGTDPAYRRRGLVRAQMRVAHQWSDERGHFAQSITGVPYYYRRFGYEMAVEIGAGRRVPVHRVPDVGDVAFTIRPAVDGDVPFLAGLYADVRDRAMVADVWDDEIWRHVVSGGSPDRLGHFTVVTIHDAAGEPVGFVGHADRVRRGAVNVFLFEVTEEAVWGEVTPYVLGYLAGFGSREGESVGEIALRLGSHHPVYEAFPLLTAAPTGAYAWYVRVPDVPGFLRHVSPVLEWRIGQSAIRGYTGDLKLNLMEHGVRIAFEQGLIAAAEAWSPAHFEDGDVQVPGGVFLHALFGHRSFEDLERAHVDVMASTDSGKALVEAMFPPAPSVVIGVE